MHFSLNSEAENYTKQGKINRLKLGLALNINEKGKAEREVLGSLIQQ